MIIDERYIKRATGLKVRAVRACESTFDELGSLDVIVAQQQNKGYGRGDHTFFSPFGGIYIVMRQNGLNIDAHTLTPTVGLAAHDAILQVAGLETELKWVNDIYFKGKKAGGILVRSPRRGEYNIGIGINYATDTTELARAGLDDATSLGAPEAKATEFVTELIMRIRSAALRPFDHARYNSLCRTVGKTVEFKNGDTTVRGYAEKVECDGSLIVRIGSATVAVDAGEVSIVRESPPTNIKQTY